MHSLFALAAPFALMLPLVAEAVDVPVDVGSADGDPGAEASAPQCDAAAAAGDAPLIPMNPLSAMRESSIARQVRIEQRVVVRIAPQPGPSRSNMVAKLPLRATAPQFEERGKEKCVALAEIGGVQTGSGNRLVLFLRDRRMISVNLEKACRARDFYAGFYVEKNKDGQLCIDRDKLQSRTGARCEVETMRQLVAVGS